MRQRTHTSEVKLVAQVPTPTSDGSTPLINNVIMKPNQYPYTYTRVIGGKVEGDLSMLVDTGSDLNYIHPELAKRFQRAGAKVESAPVKYRTAFSNQPVYATEQIWLTLVVTSGTWKPVYIETKFVIANVGENLLIGRNWLDEHGLRDLAVKPKSSKEMHVDVEGLQYLAEDMEYSMKRVSQHETPISDDALQRKLEAILAKRKSLFERAPTQRKHAVVRPFKIELKEPNQRVGALPSVRLRPMSPAQRTS